MEPVGLVLQAYEAQRRATKKQPEQVGVVHTPLKQNLHLLPLQELVWSLPVEAHKNLQGATVIMEPCKNPLMLREWLVGHTLPNVHRGRVLVQLINLGTTPISLPRHTALADLYMVPCHCTSKAKGGSDMLPSTGSFGILERDTMQVATGTAGHFIC